MKFLVTGGTGFIGAAVVRNLLQRGVPVVIGELKPDETVLASLKGAEVERMDGLHGLLSALAVGPLLVLPDEWLPEVLHEPFADESAGNRVLALLAKLNDSISAELDVEAYEPILGEVELETGPMLSAAGWCEGFSRGIDLRAALWENRLAEDPQLMELLGPVMALAVDEGILSADTELGRASGRGRV